MVVLHTAATPNGGKVSIAEEEQRKPEFLALKPNHKIPVLEDDGRVIWESGAILLQLAETYGALVAKDPAGRIAAIQYAFFQNGGIGPNLGRLAAQIRRPEGERNQK